ncbi:acetate/butyrate--CoA ligase AAE7, peroxisomal [Tanacetum coccineum]
MYEAHFGVPMSGAVINAVNIRLNTPTIAFLLEHSSSAFIMVDQEYFKLAEEALKILKNKIQHNFKLPLLIIIKDESSECDPNNLEYALQKGAVEYEKFLESGDPEFEWKPPQDEWHSIALGYTSGTTSSPKGVVLHHRGAYLAVWGVPEGAVYLWTLRMFHCNGWCFTWTLAAICGTNICLRQMKALYGFRACVYSAIATLGVTHLRAAPVVLNSIVNVLPKETILPLPRLVHVMTAGAAHHLQSSSRCPKTWDNLPPKTQAKLNARQGVPYTALEGLDVVDTQTMKPVPPNGTTVGEIVFLGNIVMKGYLKNPKANAEAFANGWVHSGDLAVKHPDGYFEIKDRSKDIIISGGENISSVEVENTLYQHPLISEASVVARPDNKWGESPCAFVTLKEQDEKLDETKSRMI